MHYYFVFNPYSWYDCIVDSYKVAGHNLNQLWSDKLIFIRENENANSARGSSMITEKEGREKIIGNSIVPFVKPHFQTLRTISIMK